jgi:hypothetical protein
MDIGGGVIRSTTTISGIDVQADTQLIGRVARTTFTFTTGDSLNGAFLVFFAESDIFSTSDDLASFIGSIAGGDLVLLQAGTPAGGLTVFLRGVSGPGSALSRFGSGLYPAFGSALESADLTVLSTDGSNFVPGPGDMGLALAFSLSGESATLVVDYETSATQRTSAAPTLSIAGMILLLCALLGLAAKELSRRRSPAPGR